MSDEVAVEALRAWRADPIRMARDLFDFTPDRWQAKVMRSWADPIPKKRIAMQACAGPGKSAMEALLGWHFQLCHSDGEYHPQGACVSISGANLRNGLWKEFAFWRERSPLLMQLFEQTTQRIFCRQYPKTWFLESRQFQNKADDDSKGRTLSGLHARRIAYFIDESGDMPPSIGRAAEQGFANADCEFGRILTGGNPTSHNGLLYQCVAKQSHLWDVHRITGDPEDPDRSPRIDIEQAREQIALYGRDNPWVMAYFLGKFPPASLNALLGPDDVRDAQARHLNEDEYNFAQKRLGIDVARFGDDRTVIFPRQGRAAFKPVIMRNARTNEIAARIAVAKERWSSELELIDSTGGWAAGVVDSCLMAGIPLMEINFSGKADDPRFLNRRAEMSFRAAEWVKSGGALPDIPGLADEACAQTYQFKDGKFALPDKAIVKEVLKGQSPDLWDGFILTFAVAEMPTLEGIPGLVNAMQMAHSGGNRGEYDPFDESRR